MTKFLWFDDATNLERSTCDDIKLTSNKRDNEIFQYIFANLFAMSLAHQNWFMNIGHKYFENILAEISH